MHDDAALVIHIHVTDPGELSAIEYRRGFAVDLFLNRTAAHHGEECAVLDRGIVSLVGEHETASGGVVLNDDVWIAGDIFREIAGQKTCVGIVGPTDICRHSECELRTRLVELFGALRRGRHNKNFAAYAGKNHSRRYADDSAQ